MDDIHQSLSNGHPISVVVYTKTNHSILRFACVLRVGILKWAMYFFRCTMDDIVYIDPNGFSYFSVELNSQGIQTNGGSLQIPGYQFNSFGIMLPDLWNSKVTSTNYCKYSIVNADGARMNCIGEWTSHL